MIGTPDLVRYLDELLDAPAIKDYCPNGLQVEGAPVVSRAVFAVTASLAVVEQAAAEGAQALIVHHGWFWRGEDPRVIGPRQRRLARLLGSDINLIGYHLPLDGHEEVGNCTLLTRAAGCMPVERVGWAGGQPLGVVGAPAAPMTLADLADQLRQVTERDPVVLAPNGQNEPVERAAFITGSGYSALEDAIRAGCQVLVTGDVREPTMAEARELGIAVIAAGHEATERLGVQALAGSIRDAFSIETRYFHDPNPI